MFLPEITDKESYSSNDFAASSNVLSPKALVDLKEWKNVHGKTAHTLLIETLYGQRQNMRSSFTNFKSNGESEGFAIFFNRHAIYDHSYYER
jgi:hypothetical protein